LPIAGQEGTVEKLPGRTQPDSIQSAAQPGASWLVDWAATSSPEIWKLRPP
jgi:hypothetical protein